MIRIICSSLPLTNGTKTFASLVRRIVQPPFSVGNSSCQPLRLPGPAGIDALYVPLVLSGSNGPRVSSRVMTMSFFITVCASAGSWSRPIVCLRTTRIPVSSETKESTSQCGEIIWKPAIMSSQYCLMLWAW